MASAMQFADPVRAVPVKFIAVGSTITNVTWLTATNGRIPTLPPTEGSHLLPCLFPCTSHFEANTA